MNTVLLDLTNWDEVLDNNGNIAKASDPYSILQDVCSYLRCCLGEVWYDTTDGIDYYGQILGKPPAIEFIKAQMEAAALEVPQVVSATCIISAFKDRDLSGQVQITYTLVEAGASTGKTFPAIIEFVGTNGQLVVFVGNSGFPLIFYGS